MPTIFRHAVQNVYAQLTAWKDIMRDARPADVQEWETAGGSKPFGLALMEALEGDLVWATANSKTLCAWGVNGHTHMRDVGNAWLVATNEAEKHALGIHRHFEWGLDEMLKFYPVLHAWADSRNTVHHHWMRKMGFRETDKVCLLGEQEVPFILFTYGKDTH